MEVITKRNKIKLIVRNPLYLIIFLSFFVRLILTFFVSDLSISYYWEHGDIAKYLLAGKGYSFFFFRNDVLSWGFQTSDFVYPSAFMPPGYVYFLLPFLMIANAVARNILLFTVQNILSCIIVFYLYKLTESKFPKSVALIAAALYAFLPEFIYTTNTIGPTLIYQLGIILFIYLIYKDYPLKKLSTVFMLALVSVITIYFRTEFAAFAIIIALYFLFKGKIKHAIVYSLTIVVLFAPWQIRNYYVFKEFIPLTTNSGFNFYKGHGETISISREVNEQSLKYRNDIALEQKVNKIFFSEGKRYLLAHPAKELLTGMKRVLHLWTISPNDPRSFHPLYFAPWLLILVLSIYGLYKTFSLKKFLFIYLFFIYHSAMAFAFYTLPRYQILLKVLLLPFAAYSLFIIYDKFKQKRKLSVN